MESPNIKGAINLAQDGYNIQLRLGIQGKPKTGKTFASGTFSNPIFASFDRGLLPLIGRKDVWELPFYDPKFVDSIVKRDGLSLPPNRKDAIIKWLETEGMKLPKDYTFVLDGNTGLQAAFHQQYWTNPEISPKTGKIDSFAEWKQKITWFTEIAMCLKALPCNVIYICHEADDRDEKGNLNGNIRPLLSGSFVDELQSHFTDWFRSLVIPKPITPEEKGKCCAAFSLGPSMLDEWTKSNTSNSIYIWQTQGDNKCTGVGTSLTGAPKYILASYEQFKKYQRKVETNE